MSDFSNSKAGDKVWDLILGECDVEFVKDGKIHVIYILEDKSETRLSYDLKGFIPSIKIQMLYHYKPNIIEQKRVVTKTINGFLNQDQNSASIFKGSYLDEIHCTITYQIEE